MRIDITLEDKRLRNLPKTLHARASSLIKACAFQIEAEAKVRAPVDTGFLRSSITTEMEGDLTGVVSVGAEYGCWVEWGVTYRPATPFLTPAVEAVRPLWEAGLRTLFEE